MNPAPSVIVFTVLSGMGFGVLAFLGLGAPQPSGWMAFFYWALGYGLAVGGLAAATFHLGNPQRALLAFSQWRTSWLSREGWCSVAALLILAPMALSDWWGLGWPREFGLVGAVLSVATVGTTSMIYAQLATVPRWNHWSTPLVFFGFAFAGGAILAGHDRIAALACLSLGVILTYVFHHGDGRFAARGQTMATATGLDYGEVSVFEQPHTGRNYLMREMIHVVGRKHSGRLRVLAVLLAGLVPALILALVPGALVVAALVHLVGALVARWLFFAEAEHVVGLYYGMR